MNERMGIPRKRKHCSKHAARWAQSITRSAG